MSPSIDEVVLTKPTIRDLPDDLRVLIIDNYDSYTLNLLQLLPRRIIKQRNFCVIRNDQLKWDYVKSSAFLDGFDCVLLSPGPGRPDKPNDIGISLSVMLADPPIPVLGICLGHQGIATAFNGDIKQSSSILHGQISRILHHQSDSMNSLYYGVPDNFAAVRYNSLVVSDQNLPKDLVVDAWCYDGDERVVMGLRHRTRPLCGVQYHPESICSEYGKEIMSNFLHGAVRYNGSCRRHIVQSNDSLQFCILAKPNLKLELQARSKKRVLVSRRISGDLSPVHLLQRLARKDNCFLIANPALVNRSSVRYVGTSCTSVHYSTRDKTVRMHSAGQERSIKLETTFWDWQNALVQSLEAAVDCRNAESTLFHGGLVGFNGYGLKSECIPGYQNESNNNETTVDAAWMVVDRWLQYDGPQAGWTACAIVKTSEAVNPTNTPLDIDFGISVNEWETWQRDLESVIDDDIPSTTPPFIPAFTSAVSRSEYISAIYASQQLISRGESYEICMTTSFATETAEPLQDHAIFDLFDHLDGHNPSRYAGILSFPHLSLHLLSVSPESFLRVEREGDVYWAEMKPIKGTRRVTKDARLDAALKIELITSDKERAENLMIVDLIRNDLCRVCDPCTVSIPYLMQVESNARVHSLVTTVRGMVHDGISAIDVIKKCFPPGSMTGAPKLRTIQLLDNLETSARGAYSGVMGWIGVNGCTELSVIIRTLMVEGKALRIGAGGAITILSDPQEEWEEVLVKARSLGLQILDE